MLFLVLLAHSIHIFDQIKDGGLNGYAAGFMAAGWGYMMWSGIKRGAERIAIPEKTKQITNGLFDLTRDSALKWKALKVSDPIFPHSFVNSSATVADCRSLNQWLRDNFGDNSSDVYTESWSVSSTAVTLLTADIQPENASSDADVREQVEGNVRELTYIMLTVRLTPGYATMFKLAFDVEE